jgi:hypothetical protein
MKGTSTRRKTYKEGGLYLIRFLDHVLKTEELLTCEVCGRVVDQDDTKLVISWWHIVDGDESTNDNRELLTIIKPAIVYSKSIKP